MDLSNIPLTLKDESLPFPKLVAFDLDYTLWPLWVDTHVYPPLKRPSPSSVNTVKDRRGYEFGLFKDVPKVLEFLKTRQVKVAACSRTSAPEVARQALKELLVIETKDGKESLVHAGSFFDVLEIYPGSKLSHFRALNKKTGISHSEMLFFDDEHRNSEVEKLGVTFHLVDEEIGVDWEAFVTGVEKWRERQKN